MVVFRKGFPIWGYVTLAVIPMIIVIAIFINGVVKIQEYKEFIRDFDDSTVYAMHNDSLRAEYKGVSTRVNFENTDLVFQRVSGSGYIFIKDEEETDDYIYFEYGNGARMWLYRYDEETLIIRYISADNIEKKYLTERITRLDTFIKLSSTEWGNSLWNE